MRPYAEVRPAGHTPNGVFQPAPRASLELCSPGAMRHKRGVKSLTEHLWFEVPSRRGFETITPTVENLVRKSGVQEGLCLVNAMHITHFGKFSCISFGTPSTCGSAGCRV
jgi:hypothetical protein